MVPIAQTFVRKALDYVIQNLKNTNTFHNKSSLRLLTYFWHYPKLELAGVGEVACDH